MCRSAINIRIIRKEKKLRIRIDLKIFIFLALFYFTNQIRIYLIIMFFCFLHEIGHIIFDHGNNNLLLPRKRKRLINWTNEVFADYFSLYHVFKNDKDKVERILKRKSKTRRKDKSSNYHPSYELRVKYIGLFDFGEELIEEIARDCGCNETFMIEKVKAWYGVSTKAVF